jgi:hypothetical protein
VSSAPDEPPALSVTGVVVERVPFDWEFELPVPAVL